MIKWVYIEREDLRGDILEERTKQLFITEILSRAFNLCKDNALEILKVIGIFIAPAMILPVIIFTTLITTAFLGASMYSYSYPYSYLDGISAALGAGTILLVIIIAILSAILSLFGMSVITKILDDANKGNEVSWRSATKYVWERKWRILGLNILVGIMIVAVMIVLFFLGLLLSLITLGIGAIIVIPVILALIFICIPITNLFNSVLIVMDLGVIDAMRETFLLFKKGYFWSTIGRLAVISAIYIVLAILLGLFEVLPIIGFIITILGQFVLTSYISAYLNVFVLDRVNPKSDDIFGNSGNDNNSGDSFIDPII